MQSARSTGIIGCWQFWKAAPMLPRIGYVEEALRSCAVVGMPGIEAARDSGLK